MGVRLSIHVNGVPVPTNNDADVVLQHKSLKDTAKDNPSQLGDPVSLKAETSKTDFDRPTSSSGGGNKTPSHEREQVFSKSAPTPTEGDVGTEGGEGGLSLKERAEQKLKNNPSALGDPVSLKAETSDNEPTDQDRGARSGKSKL